MIIPSARGLGVRLIAERRLRRGMQLHYGLAIYNATVTGAVGRPQLEGHVKV